MLGYLLTAMHCPFCQHLDTQVMDSRVTEDGSAIRRRRRCTSCDKRFTTYERVELTMPVVVKRNGAHVDFDLAKIKSSLKTALRKRPVSNEQIESTLGSIQEELYKLGQKEVSTETIGELVMNHLQNLDQVAYVRFASVYKSFSSTEEFVAAIHAMQKKSSC